MSVTSVQAQSQEAFGWAATDPSGFLHPFKFSRRATREKDVKVKILYCGICRSDLHTIKNEWGTSTYPVVPGHEIVGEVTEVGSKVERFKVGDIVGVGCMCGSCRSCDDCINHEEPYCSKMVLTYGIDHADGSKTFGGYSDIIVIDEYFVVQFPDKMPLAAGAPLLCAGATVYSPMKMYGLDKPGMRLGVVGLGGLGHVAVKFAKAMGLQVTVISNSPDKRKEAVEDLGVDSFILSSDALGLEAAKGTLDGIIDTVSVVHSLTPLIGLLKTHGRLVLVCLPGHALDLPIFPLLHGGKTVTGSIIAGMKETQEMLDFAAKNNITADVEVIPIDYINKAMNRLAESDIKFRFVIDIANTLNAAS